MNFPKRFSHWTFRYLIDRINVQWYEYKHPDFPWLTKTSFELLISLMTKEDIGLEWGSGRSTLWFAKNVKGLTSVENNLEWYKKNSHTLNKMNLKNVTYIYESDIQSGENSNYVQICNNFAPDSLDFILVDGTLRDYCALASLKILKPNGVLIIDNANLYLPSNSRSPNSIGKHEDAVSDIWKKFIHEVESWRCIWTTNGVFDTAIFFKTHL